MWLVGILPCCTSIYICAQIFSLKSVVSVLILPWKNRICDLALLFFIYWSVVGLPMNGLPKHPSHCWVASFSDAEYSVEGEKRLNNFRGEELMKNKLNFVIVEQSLLLICSISRWQSGGHSIVISDWVVERVLSCHWN